MDTSLDKTLSELFSYYSTSTDYKRQDHIIVKSLELCKKIFEKDYEIVVLKNNEGELCGSYPSEIFYCVAQKHSLPKPINCAEFQSLIQNGRLARVRQRFPVPVIFVNNKNICRSSTLAQKAELYLKSTQESVSLSVSGSGVPQQEDTAYSMEKIRSSDILLNQKLGVKYIFDFMVENRRVKFGVALCSSEKADTHSRYSCFNLAVTPYPGVEFFREYSKNRHHGKDLYFNWDQLGEGVSLTIEENSCSDISWCHYKSWDLVQLTQNYLRLLLYHVADPDENSGLLLHCLSGWDRTPLFVSLLRISLWADSEVHASLSPEEFCYFTIAYDWLLFSHYLADRTSRGEDILFFCFNFLEFVTSDEFSLQHIKKSWISPTKSVRIVSQSPELNGPALLSFQSPSTSVPIPSQTILNSFKIIDSYSNSCRPDELVQLSPSLAKIDAEFNLKNEEPNDNSEEEEEEESDHSFDDNSNEFPFDLNTPPSETLFPHPINGKKKTKKKDSKHENGNGNGNASVSSPAKSNSTSNGNHPVNNHNDVTNGNGLSPKKTNDPLPSIQVKSNRAQRLKALQAIFMKHYDIATKPPPTPQPSFLYKWVSKLAT